MKLFFIRHGDPDYANDSLTPKGFREAELLADYLYRTHFHIDHCYISPLGRAKDTARPALDRLHIKALEKDWLMEFPCRIWRPDREDKKMICWDWLPEDWSGENIFYSAEHWTENRRMEEGGVGEEYKKVTDSFAGLLESHGYVKEGRVFRAEKANNDSIVFFCHFGVTCVMLSYLLNISPMVLWHGFVAAPTSITKVVTEERRKGIASFRVVEYADITHLKVAGEPPASAARFCECFENESERHD
ncbi:MAG: histidine phosphatase family protein [Lachnospiraceae bacterium]|nr:histidine phosphatase family protein [Lachnospiraceae bacterium]